MAKHKLAYASSAVALMLGSGVFAPFGAFAEDMPTTCDGIENCAVVSTAAELSNFFTAAEGSFVTREGNSTMIIGGDFTMGADYYITDANITLYLGNYKVTAADYSFLLYNSTLTIYGSTNGSIDNTDGYYAPVYVRSGANVTMNSGTITGGTKEKNGAKSESAVILDNGGKFTLNGGAINGDTWVVSAFNDTEFTMNGGTITTTGPDSIGVAGNGTADSNKNNYGANAKLTLNAGTINSNDLGVYAPQVGGVTTLGDGLTINAKKCGVEIRAGELNVEGVTINVDEDAEYVFNPNGSGSTASGVGIAVAQHTTTQPINVNVKSGTFTAPVAFAEDNPQGNADEDIAKVSVVITGGTFNATNGDPVVASTDVTKFITGGTYNKEVASAYIADGYVAIEDAESYEVVKAASEIKINQGYDVEEVYSNENVALGIEYTPEDAVVDFEVTTDKPELFVEDSLRIVNDGKSYGVMFNAAQTGSGEATLTVTDKISGNSASIKVNVLEAIMYDRAETEDGTIADVFFGEPVEGENLGVEITSEELTTEEKAKISPYLKAVYDISVVNQDTNEIVSVSGNDIEIDLILKSSDYEGMNYFKVAYINDEGEIAEVFDAEVSRDEENDWLVLTFNTTHLSSYGVLASETEFPETLTPDTGAFTGSASMHGDYRGLVATVVAMTVMTIVMEVVMYRKNHAKNVK